MDSTGDVRLPTKVAWLPFRFQLPYALRLSRGCVPFGLLTALGLLAFLFSVVSPYDDDVQQEFVQGKKPTQCVVVKLQSCLRGSYFRYGQSPVRANEKS